MRSEVVRTLIHGVVLASAFAAWGCTRQYIPTSADCDAPAPAATEHPEAAYRALAVDPNAYVIPHPAYVIGLERLERRLVGSIPYWACPQGMTLCLNFRSKYLSNRTAWLEKLEARLDDSERLFLTHIVRYDHPLGTEPWTGTLLATLYRDNTLACTATTCLSQAEAALAVLQGDLKQRVANIRPSHVILYVTGGDRDQAASVHRYTRWFDQLMDIAQRDAAVDFRPLFIAVTWPADRTAIPGEPDAVKDDADEVAVTWVNYLLNRLLVPLKADGVKVVAVGHDLGARIVTTAANSRDLLAMPTAERPNLVLGLQPAFAVQRFGGGREGQPYAEFPMYADKFVFTASQHDGVKENGDGSDTPISGGPGLAEVQRPTLGSRFEVVPVDKRGNWMAPPAQSAERVTMLDTSTFVACHNDVYGPTMGRAIWNTIQRFAE